MTTKMSSVINRIRRVWPSKYEFQQDVYDVFSYRVGEKRHFRLWFILLGYISVILDIIIPVSCLNSKTFVYDTSRNIGESITILTALLIPICIVTIETAKSNTLQRYIVLNAVLKIKPLSALILISSIAILVADNEQLNIISLVISIITVMFSIDRYIRTIYWLNDQTLFDMDNADKDNLNQFYIADSYRLGVLHRTTSSLKTYKLWVVLWNGHYGASSEIEINDAFFRQFDILTGKQMAGNFSAIGNELSSYIRNIDKRSIRQLYLNDTYDRFLYLRLRLYEASMSPQLATQRQSLDFIQDTLIIIDIICQAITLKLKSSPNAQSTLSHAIDTHMKACKSIAKKHKGEAHAKDIMEFFEWYSQLSDNN